MYLVTILSALLLAGCGMPWAVKGDCWSGGKWNEYFDTHAEIKCGVKAEITLVRGEL